MAETPEIEWSPEAGERLDRLITAVGGTSVAATITGMSDDTLLAWRKGKARWNFWAIARLCLAANQSMDWLSFGRTSPESRRLTEATVEQAAEYILRAAREFPELKPEDIARSIVRRARDLEEIESSLTADERVGEQYTSR